MAKKVKKLVIKCTNCKNYDGTNCHKKGNVGVVIKFRQEHQFFVKKSAKINQDKNCKDFSPKC